MASKANKKKIRQLLSPKVHLIGWLTSIAVFAAMLLPHQSNPVWGNFEIVLLLGDMFLGVVFFCTLIILLMVKYKWARYIFGAIFIIGILFSSWVIMRVANSNKNTTELIECYVDGVAIKATRDNCQLLSLQPTAMPQQPAQIRVVQQSAVIQAPQIPIIEPPTTCTTSQDYFTGNLKTTCQKSWF